MQKLKIMKKWQFKTSCAYLKKALFLFANVRLLFQSAVLLLILLPAVTHANSIHGAIADAGKGVAGYRIVATQEIRVGYKIDAKPCRTSPASSRTLGTVQTASDGSFSITYTATPKPPGSCSFSSKVYIKVYNGTRLVWTSPKVAARSRVIFDHNFVKEPPITPVDRLKGIDGGYSFKNKQSGKYLDVKGGSDLQGGKIWQFNLNYSASQRFQKILKRDYGDNYFVIQPDIPNDVELYLSWSTINKIIVTKNQNHRINSSGLKIIQDIWYNIQPTSGIGVTHLRYLRHQVWKITPAENESNTYFIEAMGFNNRKVLSAESNESGTDLNLVNYNGQDNQKWIITKNFPEPPSNLILEEFYYSIGWFGIWGNEIRGTITWDDNSNDETGFEIYITRQGIHYGSHDPIQIPSNISKYTFGLPTKHGYNQEHCIRLAAYNKWGTSRKTNTACAIASNPKNPPPPPDPHGFNKIFVWNCHSNRESINVWVRDLSGNNPWIKKGTLPSQWSGNGCPSGTPLEIQLEDKHTYYVMANDCDDNPNMPWNNCDVMEATFFRGSNDLNSTYRITIIGSGNN